MEAAGAAAADDEEREALVQAYLLEYRATDDWDAAGVAVEDLSIDGPHGPIPLRLYRPEAPAGGALLWAHGGGFRHGDLDMPEGHIVSLELARRASVVVASVDYRLAESGANRHPVPIDDVHAAWTWLCERDPARGGPAAIGGASAGAALALSATLRARDAGPRLPDAMLLAYPFAHYPNPAPSPALSAEMAGLPFRFEAEGVEEMVRNYVGRISDVPADALPGAARLDGLPRALLMAAEYDDLRSSAELLERQLREVGVPVEPYLALGMTHGHLNHSPKVAEVDRSLDFFANGLSALRDR
nr:alpha/beta hydrolase [Glycomyces amatae]